MLIVIEDLRMRIIKKPREYPSGHRESVSRVSEGVN